MNTLKIKVTQEHIDKGEPLHGTLCPIALAIKPFIKEPNYVVRKNNIVVHKDGVWKEWAITPMIAHDFIDSFDNGRPVEPFEFEVNI